MATLLAAATITFGQGMKEATELAQAANAAIQSGDSESALNGFTQALAIAETLGEEGAELTGQCKDIIPQIMMSIAKKKVNAGEYDAALADFEKIATTIEKFGGNLDIINEMEQLRPDILLSKGNAFLRNEQYAEAAAVYKSLLSDDKTGEVAFNLGQALAKQNDIDGAKEAFNKAKTAGYETSLCEKQLLNLDLKSALAAYKKGSLSAAVDGAVGCIEKAGDNASIKSNASGIIVGCIQTAAVKYKKPSDAVGYYNKLVEVDPNNDKLVTLAFYIGYGFYNIQNNGQAKVWLSKAVSDPKNGANAKKILEAIK